MTNRIGVNLLAQFLANRAETNRFLSDLNPALVVVMDDPAFAQTARALLPDAVIVHRAYNANDARWHEAGITPQQWVDSHAPAAAHGVVLQCWNEPSGYGDNRQMVEWTVGALNAAKAKGIRLAAPNWGVGHPEEANVNAGVYDPILRAIGTHHYLAVHEYAQQSSVSERPYHIGRFESLLKRCDVLGIPRPRVLVTEYGRDVGGGENDGWRGAGLSEDAYFSLLVGGMDVYKRNNALVAIFCEGRGAAGRWQSFNIEGADRLRSRLIQYGKDNPVTQITPPVQPPTKPPAGFNWGDMQSCVVKSVNGSYINVRREANTTSMIIGSVKKGDFIKSSANSWASGGNNWRKVEQADGLAGYFASQYATLTEVVTPSPEEKIVDDVPYYSQVTSPGAERDKNDCGETCVRMLIGWGLKQSGLPDFPMLTIDDLSRDAGKPLHAFLSLGQVQALLRGYNYARAAYLLGGLTLNKIEQEINAGKPLIALVRYAFIKPDDSFKGGHFVVVIGYSATHIIIHDPYNAGANYRVTRAAFEQALTEWEGTNPHHSGIVIAA